MFGAFAAIGVEAEPVVYGDDTADAVRDRLLGLDGVLVWVNPVEQGKDRSTLDALLREVGKAGVFVSAHPDVILRMGTKQVLVDTNGLSWGTETRLYRTADELRERLQSRLRETGALVLKQRRGMGGQGVWKVEPDGTAGLVVQHAADPSSTERISLDAFLRRCEPYFADGGLVVEQPFVERIAEGMIRAYLVHDEVVGFTHQYPRGLVPPGSAPGPPGKIFEPAATPRYRALRARLESEWVPAMQELVGVETPALPVIWDADFLYGERTDDGEDTYVLCEINVSSTFAFPAFAMPAVAEAAVARIRELGA
jgi:uncharacterized protein DUF6815